MPVILVKLPDILQHVINEHFTGKRSHVYKHIHKNPACLEKSNKECFLILDQTNTDWQLQIKEGLYIGWETLN